MVFLPFLRGEVIKAGADFDKLCEPFYHIHRMPRPLSEMTEVFFYSLQMRKNTL